MTADVYSHLYEQDDPGKAAALDAAYTATGTTNLVPLRAVVAAAERPGADGAPGLSSLLG